MSTNDIKIFDEETLNWINPDDKDNSSVEEIEEKRELIINLKINKSKKKKYHRDKRIDHKQLNTKHKNSYCKTYYKRYLRQDITRKEWDNKIERSIKIKTISNYRENVVKNNRPYEYEHDKNWNKIKFWKIEYFDHGKIKDELIPIYEIYKQKYQELQNKKGRSYFEYWYNPAEEAFIFSTMMRDIHNKKFENNNIIKDKIIFNYDNIELDKPKDYKVEDEDKEYWIEKEEDMDWNDIKVRKINNEKNSEWKNNIQDNNEWKNETYNEWKNNTQDKNEWKNVNTNEWKNIIENNNEWKNNILQKEKFYNNTAGNNIVQYNSNNFNYKTDHKLKVIDILQSNDDKTENISTLNEDDKVEIFQNNIFKNNNKENNDINDLLRKTRNIPNGKNKVHKKYDKIKRFKKKFIRRYKNKPNDNNNDIKNNDSNNIKMDEEIQLEEDISKQNEDNIPLNKEAEAKSECKNRKKIFGVIKGRVKKERKKRTTKIINDYVNMINHVKKLNINKVNNSIDSCNSYKINNNDFEKIKEYLDNKQYDKANNYMKRHKINIRKLDDFYIKNNNKKYNVITIEDDLPGINKDNPSYIFKFDLIFGYDESKINTNWSQSEKYIFVTKGFYTDRKHEIGTDISDKYLIPLYTKMLYYTCIVFQPLKGVYITYVCMKFNDKYTINKKYFPEWLMLSNDDEKFYYIRSGNYGNGQILFNETIYPKHDNFIYSKALDKAKVKEYSEKPLYGTNH